MKDAEAVYRKLNDKFDILKCIPSDVREGRKDSILQSLLNLHPITPDDAWFIIAAFLDDQP
jgi:hypothetical protein